MTTTHALACRDGHARATWRKANDPLTDAIRDRVILRAIEAGAGYDGIQAALDEARADIADGLVDERGELIWAY